MVQAVSLRRCVQQEVPGEVETGGRPHPRERQVSNPTPRYRYSMWDCDTHDCSGDDTCIAKQSPIFAIDGSGSLTAKGFEVLKDLATQLIGKYRGEYFGSEDMQTRVEDIMEDSDYVESGSTSSSSEGGESE